MTPWIYKVSSHILSPNSMSNLVTNTWVRMMMMMMTSSGFIQNIEKHKYFQHLFNMFSVPEGHTCHPPIGCHHIQTAANTPEHSMPQTDTSNMTRRTSIESGRQVFTSRPVRMSLLMWPIRCLHGTFTPRLNLINVTFSWLCFVIDKDYSLILLVTKEFWIGE